MKPFVRNLVLSAAVAATALAVVPSAHALDRRGRQVDQNTANLIGAGVIGLAAGVIVGSIVASTNDAPPHDRNPRPRPHQDRGFTTLLPADANQGYQNYGDYDYDGPRHGRYNQRGYAQAYQAWSPEWYRWCENRYKSFNPRKGTYVTYGGEERFCVVR